MSRLTTTARCELLQLWRDRRIRIAVPAMLLLYALAFSVSWEQQQRHAADVRAVTQADRQLWERQGSRNPHSVAHFGQYAFKPVSVLSAFDPGASPWLGTALWMEAHYQNTATFRAIDDQALPPLIATLSPAFILQLLVPLLLIFLGYPLIAREREQQTLKLALANGASLPALVGGKLLALLAMAALVALPLLAPVALAENDDARLRALLLFSIYGIHLACVAALVVGVSALMRTARAALLALLCGWVMMALIVPRVASLLAEQIAPSTEAGEFWRATRQALKTGINGQDSPAARDELLVSRTLAAYAVQRLDDLPVSFAGLALQADEEHGNQIFDHFYGKMRAEYARQHTVLQLSGLLSPWTALQSLSTALAGTDQSQHWHFANAAEQHRRQLQRYLNGLMTEHGRGKDFDYRAEQAAWRQAPEFRYRAPELQLNDAALTTDLVLLLAWAVVATALLAVAARALSREGALA